MTEEEKFELQIPPGTPNMEDLLTEVLKLFPNLKLVTPKDLDDPYYLAVRGDLRSVQEAREYIRKRLEKIIEDLEKKNI
jgi:hypothetical protein